jgi:hypothetical protein
MGHGPVPNEKHLPNLYKLDRLAYEMKQENFIIGSNLDHSIENQPRRPFGIILKQRTAKSSNKIYFGTGFVDSLLESIQH